MSGGGRRIVRLRRFVSVLFLPAAILFQSWAYGQDGGADESRLSGRHATEAAAVPAAFRQPPAARPERRAGASATEFGFPLAETEDAAAPHKAEGRFSLALESADSDGERANDPSVGSGALSEPVPIPEDLRDPPAPRRFFGRSDPAATGEGRPERPAAGLATSAPADEDGGEPDGASSLAIRDPTTTVSSPIVVPEDLVRPPAVRPGSLLALQRNGALPSLAPPAQRPLLLSLANGSRQIPALALGSGPVILEPASIREIVARAGLSGITGAFVFDLANGRVLDAHARQISAPPASTIKLATAIWALEELGPRHRFETRLLATGPVADGWVQGDLILQGTGDPALDNRALARMVDELVSAGVRGVRGRFLLDATALPSASWIDERQPDAESSNPGFAALNLNFNRVRLERVELDGGEVDAHAIAASDEVEIRAPHVSVRVLPGGRTRVVRHSFSGEGEIWEIDRRTLLERPPLWLPVRDPVLYAGSVFRSLAAERGMQIPEPERSEGPASGSALAVHRGRPLAELVAAMLHYSNNLTAEMVGLATAAAGGEPVAGLQDGAQRLAGWVGEDFARYNRLTDFSGLGDRASIAPSAFWTILLKSIGGANASETDVRRILPVHDPGTASPDGRHMATIQAKTGTLYYVRGLVGFIRMNDGTARELGFAIYSTDLRRRRILQSGNNQDDPTRLREARQWRDRAIDLEGEILRNWIRAFS